MSDVDWVPNAENLRGNWQTNGERSSWQDQPSLQANLSERSGMIERIRHARNVVKRLGSTIGLSDSSGAVQTQYTYEPFGKTSASGTVSTNSLQFTGRENDDTALYYYRARYYSPTLQRFIDEDPLGFAGGDLNLYAYVRNSPLNFVDPSGQDTFEFGVGGSGRAGIAVVGSLTIAVDGSGNVGVTYTGGAGAGIAVGGERWNPYSCIQCKHHRGSHRGLC